MHDLALYRKYRPKKFKEVLGQNHIVDVLESSVETNKVSHAYLFVGSRGTGKTSVARIFATNEIKRSFSGVLRNCGGALVRDDREVAGENRYPFNGSK